MSQSLVYKRKNNNKKGLHLAMLPSGFYKLRELISRRKHPLLYDFNINEDREFKGEEIKQLRDELKDLYHLQIKLTLLSEKEKWQLFHSWVSIWSLTDFDKDGVLVYIWD